MNIPKGKKTATLRRKLLLAKQRFLGGKALKRIEYFETQRALSKTTLDRGFVSSQSVESLRISRKPPTRRRPRLVAEYSKADRAKARLIPTKFAANVQLPVWRPLTDQQPTLSMGAICGAPSSPNIVYAGTGEGDTYSQLGVGLLRSSDSGQTWEHAPSNDLSGIGIFDIAVDPANPLHVWVGTTTKLLESNNGGATWRTVQNVTTWDISINPNDPQEIFVATVLGLIRSTNGGANWTQVGLPGATPGSHFTRMEVCHAPSRPAVVYVAAVQGDSGRLWRRASSGGAFSSERTPSLDPQSDIDQAWYDWCLAVSPTDPDVLYWGAVQLFKGSRGVSGWTWRNISSRSSGDSIHPDQHYLAFDPSDPTVLYACNDGGIFRSPDGGTSWTSLNPGLGITEFEFIIHLESEDTWLIGGTQDN